jgi:DNA-binding response OmpR family regulator
MTKLLIVDDSLDLLEALKIFLEKKGYCVHTLADHHQIFDEIKKVNPDLLLLDIFLSGEDGRDICKKLREHVEIKNMCIMMFSASPEALKNYKIYGADGYIEKPFNLSDLIKKIDAALGIYKTVFFKQPIDPATLQD